MFRKIEAIVPSDCLLSNRLTPDEDRARRSPARSRPKNATPAAGAIVLMSDRIKTLPRAKRAKIFLCVGGNAYHVTSFAQASQMFCIARDTNGEGASNTPSPLIVDDAGSVVAHISYNGRVWPGNTWTVEAVPLYDNRGA